MVSTLRQSQYRVLQPLFHDHTAEKFASLIGQTPQGHSSENSTQTLQVTKIKLYQVFSQIPQV